MTTAATASNDREASWSHYGSRVDVRAPGVSILSTRRAGGTTTLSGTSVATGRASLGGLVVLLLGLLGFGVGGAGGAVLDLLLKGDKATYARGEPIALTLEVVNRGPHPVTLTFQTAQRYDIVVRDAQGREVWRWSAGQMFAQMLGEEILPRGPGALTYRVILHERFAPGRYTAVGIIPAEEAPISANLDFTIR